MTKCDTCKNRIDCKIEQQQAFQVIEKMGEASCSGYEYEKPKTEEELKKEFFARYL